MSQKRSAETQLRREDVENEGREEQGETITEGFRVAKEEVLTSRRIVRARRPATVAGSGGEGALPTVNPFATISFAPPEQAPLVPKEDTVEAKPAEANVVEAAESTGEEVTSAPIAQPGVESGQVEQKEDGEREVETAKKVEVEGKDVETVGGSAEGVGIQRKEVIEISVKSGNDLEDKPSAIEKGLLEGTGEKSVSSSEIATSKLLAEGEVVGETSTADGENGETVVDLKESKLGRGPSGGFAQHCAATNAFKTGFGAVEGGFGAVEGAFGNNSGESSEVPIPAQSSLSSLLPPSGIGLQGVPNETGEEKEKAVFTVDASLFEFEGGGWKERGKGEVRVNLSEEENRPARIVMRGKGHLRLLLNASLYDSMMLKKMDGKGVTFASINSIGDAKLTTFALRFSDESAAADFLATAEAHKGRASSSK